MDYIFTFVEGILTFISPCILPMLPIYFLYLAGIDNGSDVLANKNKLLKNSIGFVIGFTIVFILLGASVTAIGFFLTQHKDAIRQISGIVMVVFGLNFAGVIKLAFLNLEGRLQYKVNRLNFFSAILFGIIFSFGWSPCLGTFLGSALVLASNSETILDGMLLLFVYSMGLAIPFVLSAILFDRAKGVFGQIKQHSRIITIVSGLLLIVFGVLIFFDVIKYMNIN